MGPLQERAEVAHSALAEMLDAPYLGMLDPAQLATLEAAMAVVGYLTREAEAAEHRAWCEHAPPHTLAEWLERWPLGADGQPTPLPGYETPTAAELETARRALERRQAGERKRCITCHKLEIAAELTARGQCRTCWETDDDADDPGAALGDVVGGIFTPD